MPYINGFWASRALFCFENTFHSPGTRWLHLARDYNPLLDHGPNFVLESGGTSGRFVILKPDDAKLVYFDIFWNCNPLIRKSSESLSHPAQADITNVEWCKNVMQYTFACAWFLIFLIFVVRIIIFELPLFHFIILTSAGWHFSSFCQYYKWKSSNDNVMNYHLSKAAYLFSLGSPICGSNTSDSQIWIFRLSYLLASDVGADM